MCGQKQKEKNSIENVAQDDHREDLIVGPGNFACMDSNAVTAVQMMSIGEIRMVAAPWASARTRAHLASLARFDNPLPLAAIEP